jgi:CyaY protein
MYLAAMNPREEEDAAFDKLADGQLRRLDRVLSRFDPDEVECDIAGDVLNITLTNSTKIVINRHRAARQIWMAAQRRAWHFNYDPASNTWRTADAELISQLEQILAEQLKRPISLQP